MKKKRYDIKTFSLAVAAIVMPLLLITHSTETVVRPPASDTSTPTLGVNTLRFNGKLIVTSTDSAGRRYGFQVGDVISKVEDKPVKMVSDFIAAAESKNNMDRVCVLLEREDQTVSIRRKFRGLVRGENGERQVDESIKQVGEYARIDKKARKRIARKKKQEEEKRKTTFARVRSQE